MVAPANSGPREPRAPEIPQAATAVYEPGDVVQLRLGAGKPEIILWVEQSTWLFSSSLAYVTTNGEQKFRRDPAEVVRIGPPAVPSAVTTVPGVPPASPGAEVAPDVVVDPAGITWHQTSAIRKTSVNGRFEIVAGPGAYYVATDHWTGESTGDLANESSALSWCRTRIVTADLRWQEDESGWRARDDFGGEWHIFRTTLNASIFRSTDSRLGLGDPLTPIRSSPDFCSLDAAKAWCEVRATCVVEVGGTLRYDPVAMIIPF